MNVSAQISDAPALPLNRANGCVRLSVKPKGNKSGIETLYQAGALKAVFPRTPDMTCVLVNTAGGITGGDQFSTQAHVRPNAKLTLTTQAAERAYRARPHETGTVRTTLCADENATLRWLPQETILFDRCNLNRCLTVKLTGQADALIVEPMIFGRAAMGENQIDGSVRDRIEIFQDDQPIYIDSWSMSGDLSAQMARPAIGGGATAMASLIWVSPKAETSLDTVRALLPQSAGASLRAPNMLCVRMQAKDGYNMRKTLLPVLDHLTQNSLPTCWRL
ncbi:MAG: urease accessory protein UreD [Paracoccaceae bacterium]